MNIFARKACEPERVVADVEMAIGELVRRGVAESQQQPANDEEHGSLLQRVSRSELGKPPQTRLRTQGSAQEQVRKLGRDDFAPRQRPADKDLAGDIVPPLQRAIAISLREIDDLIVELRRRREALLGETARMQSEIIEYARLNQSTIDSTKTITERLANFNKAPDADSIRETTIENNQEDRESSQAGSAGSTEDASAQSSPDTQTKRTEEVIPTEGFATGGHPAFPSEVSVSD